MITMLLVEDESFGRTSLATCVDWALIGVEIIGEAANGSQGLAKVLELKPDIVLTDVKMPVMDGIEMSRRVRIVSPNVKILFLSSYDDFEYAKQAIDLNISAYLMKPVNEMELLRAVKKAADEINEKMLERRLLTKEQDNLSRSLSLARQTLVNRALGGMGASETDARNLRLDWLLYPDQQFLLVLCSYATGALHPIDAKLEQLMSRVSKVFTHSVGLPVNAGQLVVLCGIGQEDAQQMARRVGFALRDFFEMESVDVRVTMEAGGDVAAQYASLMKKNARAPRAAVSEKKGQNKKQIVTEIERVINEQYTRPLSLESIARELHFTPNYIGTIFKSVTNTSVNNYLLKVRLERSKQMLESKAPMSLGKIAEACGFGSNTYFHTIFKRMTGITPNEYRRNAEKAHR